MKQTIEMIRKAFVFTGFFLIGYNSLYAQELPRPDFVNVPAYYIKGSNELQNLAKENFSMVGKIGKAMYEVQGVSSKVRIKQTDDYILIVKAGEIDPSTMMYLKKATVKKKKRQASMVAMQGLTKVTTSKDDLPYHLKKLDDHVYQIIPESQLKPGEYFLIVAGATVYSFGIE